MAFYDEEFEKRRRRLLGERKVDSKVAEKPSQRAAFEQRRKRILATKEAPIARKVEPEPEEKPGLFKRAKQKVSEVIKREKEDDKSVIQKVVDITGKGVKAVSQFLFGEKDLISPVPDIEIARATGDEERVEALSQVYELLRQNKDQLETSKSEFDLKMKSKSKPGVGDQLREGAKSLFYTGTASMDKEDLARFEEINTLKQTEILYKQFLGMEEANKGLVREVFSQLKTEPLKTLIPFFKEKRNLVKYASANEAEEKLNSGEELTSLEKASLENREAQVLMQGIDRGLGDQVGGMLVDMVPYLMLYGFSMPVSAKAEATMLTRLGVKKVSEKTASNVAKSIIAKGIGIAAQTSTVFAPKVAEGTAEYMLPDYELVAGEKGDKFIQAAGGGDDFKKALAKSWLVTYIELGVERMGGLIEPMTDKIMQKAIIGRFAKLKNITTPSVLTKTLKSVGWNGPIGEVFEEELTELLQAPVEERKFYAPFLTPEGTERLLVETLGISIFGGIAGVANISLNTLNKAGEPRLKPIDLNVDETIKDEPVKPGPIIPAELPQEGEVSPPPPVKGEVVPGVEPKKEVTEAGRVEEAEGEVQVTLDKDDVTRTKELQPLVQEARKFKTAEEFADKLLSGEVKPEGTDVDIQLDKLRAKRDSLTKEVFDLTGEGKKLSSKEVVPLNTELKKVESSIDKLLPSSKEAIVGTITGDVALSPEGTKEAKQKLVDFYNKAKTKQPKIEVEEVDEGAETGKELEARKKLEQKPKVTKEKPKLGKVTLVSTDELIKIVDKGGHRTKEQIAELRSNIIANGIKYPVELVEEEDGSFTVWDGNNRIRIADDLKITKIEVKVVKSKVKPKPVIKPPKKKPPPKPVVKLPVKPGKRFITVKDKGVIQKQTEDAINTGNTQEEAVVGIEKYLTDVFNSADSLSYIKRLKVIRAEMKRQMYDLIGADTGHWKTDYALFQKMRDNPDVVDLVDRIEEGIFEIDEKVNPAVVTTLGSATTGSKPVSQFEKRSKPKENTNEFKLFKKTQELIKKYANTIGEGYMPRNALGMYYTKTKNIRVNALNDLSTVAHEITHFLDAVYKISDKLMALKGYSVNGRPIYDPKLRKYRKDITKLYTKYYGGGKATHSLRKRATEGFATLLQKYVETPTKIEAEFPLLVKDFLKPGGKFYQPIMGDILTDLNEIIDEYQGLSSLDKIGARITSEDTSVNKESFLGFRDKVREFLADKIFPWEVLSIKTPNIHFTPKDPSLWIRTYNSVSGIINNNISTDRGYWTLTTLQDGFQKKHDFNWKTLVGNIDKELATDDFAAYLVARREHFSYLELDQLKEDFLEVEKEYKKAKKDERLDDKDDDGTTARSRFKVAGLAVESLNTILEKDGFSRGDTDEAYEQNKERFKQHEKMFDTLTREDLNFLNNGEIQLLTPKQHKKLTSQQGYASFKRQFYDEIVGDQNEVGGSVKVGGVKVSSLLRRKGSQKTIFNPLYSALNNHSEVMRKGLKQLVYNRIMDIGLSGIHPTLFQELNTITSVDKQTGVVRFPQEKDPNIIMGRKDYKRKPVLVDSKLKKILDDTLTYENVEIFEKIVLRASRVFTQGTTGLYPQFTATNYVVDQPTGAVNSTNKFIPVLSSLNQLRKMIFERSGTDWEYYQEYLIMGGERQTFTGWQQLAPKELFKKVNQEKQGIEKVIRLVDKGIDIWSTPAKYSELTSRAAEYVNSRKAGKSQIVALEEAGRVTAPFHHIGKWGGKKGQMYVKTLPFFNALLQVIDQTTRTAQTPKGRSRIALMTIAVTAAQLASTTALMRFGSDDQKNQYIDLEPDELVNFLYFPNPTGKKLLKLRLSPYFSTIGTILNMAISDQILKTGYTKQDYLNASTAGIPDQFNLTRPSRMLFSVFPQLLKAPIETVVGFKTYPEVRPLESMALQNLPKKFRYNKNSSAFAKWLGDKANLSPVKIDHLITGWLGRSTGILTGRPSAYDFTSSFNREYWFTSGRRVSGAWDLKEENDKNYTAYQRGLEKLSDDEVAELYRVKILTNDFLDLMSDYRKVDVDKEPDEADKIKTDTLELIDNIEAGVKPDGYYSWVRKAEKRRKEKIKELAKLGK